MKENKISTRDLILQVAKEQFSIRGYTNTPIRLILEKAGISKGGFYHHFASKEEIIDILAKMQVDSVVDILYKISEDKESTAIEKFNELILKMLAFRSQNRDHLYRLFDVFMRDDNLELKYKIDTYTFKMVKPPYVKIVEQGINEGVFHTSSPELAVETIIRVAPALRLKMAKLYIEKNTNDHVEADIRKVADFLEEIVLKILGANEGSLKISELFTSYFFDN